MLLLLVVLAVLVLVTLALLLLLAAVSNCLATSGIRMVTRLELLIMARSRQMRLSRHQRVICFVNTQP